MSKCPAVARGGGGGGWAPLELIDALIANSGKFMKITFFDSVPFSLYHLGFT